MEISDTLWISRSQRGDLMLHTCEPSKGYDDLTREWYWGSIGEDIQLPEEMFPQVTYQNSPQLIELKLLKRIQ